jgi:Linalool dehydratase/isomerase
MTTIDRTHAPVGANGVLLLPEHPPRLGPVSRRLFTRLVVVLAAVVVLGTAFVAFGGRALRAAGLSLIFPGGGFLYAANPLLFLLTIAILTVAIVLWWGISAHWAIPLVAVASSVGAGLMADGPRLFVGRDTVWTWAIPVVYVLAAAAIGIAVYRFEARYRRKLARVPELNEYLASVPAGNHVKATVDPVDFDSQLLRWAYEMALQPIDQFKGFDWGEQIHGPTCVRYQLNFLGVALALYTVNYVPNARQSVEAAMANLIEKQTDLRVWRYWRTLNTIGNFDRNPDPIVRDNIMISAYLTDQINCFEAATGSTRFDEPGSLTYVWKDGRTFSYDHGTIAAAVRRNFQANRLGLFPCEPGWVFTACNAFGAQALKGHETLHGSDHWQNVEPHWRRGVTEEMLTPDGNFPHIRSKVVGLSFDTGEVPGGEYYLTGTGSFADTAPDLAIRGAALALRGADAKIAALADAVVDGVLPLDFEPKFERNTFIKTAVPEWTRLVGAARGVGREDVAQAALRGMERSCGTGQQWPARPLRAGVQTMGIHLFVRWATPNGTAQLSVGGYQPTRGPILAGATWPEVLVTKARSDDEVSLDLIVEPGRDAAVSTTLHFEALRPGQPYRLVGEHVDLPAEADGNGRASISLDLDTRHRLRLEPAP